MSFPYSLNCHGRLFSLARPQVMGILNLTPDSFYPDSRKQSEAEIIERVQTIITQGGTMIDVGAYSSRPTALYPSQNGADDVPADEEMARLRRGLSLLRREAPDAVVSVDTFRADVARMCVEEYGVDIINDISGGEMDHRMFLTVARLGVPYILMHMQGTPSTMQQAPAYDNLLGEMALYFSRRIDRLHSLGVSDIILDPGFCFGKTLAHNYHLMAHLSDFAAFDLPLLVGVSRKSMIHRLLDLTPSESLNGTTALHMASLLAGAHILRVHDVAEAVQTVKIHQAIAEAR